MKLSRSRFCLSVLAVLLIAALFPSRRGESGRVSVPHFGAVVVLQADGVAPPPNPPPPPKRQISGSVYQA